MKIWKLSEKLQQQNIYKMNDEILETTPIK